MRHVRAAIYVDFDNVFGGLFKLDPEAAIQFASDPGSWLARLSTTLTVEAPRRWLVLRCYLNPAGWVTHVDAAGEPARLYFSRFRPAFVRAGFEVIDCPRYNATKNGADIRIVVDAVDAEPQPVQPLEEGALARCGRDGRQVLPEELLADRAPDIDDRRAGRGAGEDGGCASGAVSHESSLIWTIAYR